jgi:hypothetical protein
MSGRSSLCESVFVHAVRVNLRLQEWIAAQKTGETTSLRTTPSASTRPRPVPVNRCREARASGAARLFIAIPVAISPCG